HVMTQAAHALPVGGAARRRRDPGPPGTPTPRARTPRRRISLARQPALLARGHLLAWRPPARRRHRDRAARGSTLRRLVRSLSPRGLARGARRPRDGRGLLPAPPAARRDAALAPPRRRGERALPPAGSGARRRGPAHARLLHRALHLLRSL